MRMKSGIYAVNTVTGTAIADGGTYSPNLVQRKYGCALLMESGGISINEIGYYDVNVIATVVATAIGEVTATLYKDGIAIPGATVTASAAAIGDYIVLPISALVRSRCCVDAGAILTVKISGQATTSENLTWNVEKE